jgi:DNA polymerase-1
MPQLEKEGLIPLFRDVEMPLVPVIADMELNGQLVDEAQTIKIYDEHEAYREQVSADLHSQGLQVDNLNSTEQVALSLEKLGAPLQERTPSKGHFVVDDDKLLSIREWNPGLVDSLLDYRRAGKRQSYLRNFLELRGTDGRLQQGASVTVALLFNRSLTVVTLRSLPPCVVA